MKNFKTGYYQADTVNGVTFYGELMYNLDGDIITAKDFFEALDTLDESEKIYTFVGNEDADIWDKIEEEYGIRQ